MKKNIINSVYGLALASLMLTACSSAEDATTANVPPTVDETAINFGAYMNRSTTRGGWATELTTATLQGADAGFGVLAYYTDNQPYTPTALPNFMYNQKVTYNASEWVYAPLKYWPNEFGTTASSTSYDRLSFFAYAPYAEIDPVTGYATAANYGIVGMTRSAESGNPKVRYSASFKPNEQVDLCWAEPLSDMIKPAIDNKVTFTFKHALSSLNIQIDALFDELAQNAGALDSYTRIWVRSVTFEGLAVKGELNLNNSEHTPEWHDLYSNGLLSGEPVTIYDGRRDGREGYAAMDNEKPVAINPVLVQSAGYTIGVSNNALVITAPDATHGVTTTAVNLFDGAANATDPIYVIPTGEPLRITIVYDVETFDPNLTSSFLSDTETNGSSIENVITKVVEDTNGPVTLVAGKKYDISLHLGMTSAKFDVNKVWGWDEDENGDPQTPVEGNTDLPANN